MNPWLISVPAAYLLGSIPFGYLLVRIFRNEDIRASGSGNIGATNVARSGAKGLGIATLFLDAGKGFLAVYLAFLIAPPNRPHTIPDIAMAAAIAAILGHVFPVWLGFRGGKGVATALGVLLALTPTCTLGIVGVFIAVFAVSRYVSLASILAAATVPAIPIFFIRPLTPFLVFGFLFIPLVVIVKHHANIRRLLAGTESRFGKSKPAAADKKAAV